MKTILKIVFIGVIATICRIVLQLFLPDSSETALPPSVFVENGLLPLVFTVFGIILYSSLAAMFLLLRNRATGNKVMQGVKYGAAYAIIWAVYLFEPLPHTGSILSEGIPYILADSAGLLIMGTLSGLLLGQSNEKADRMCRFQKAVVPIIIITAAFVSVRLIQYLVFDMYSSFDTKPVQTVLWISATGLITAVVLFWFNLHIQLMGKMQRAFIIGCVLFGVNLWLFNFFMPLVFDVDILGVAIRTAADMFAITIGCISLDTFRYSENMAEQ